MNTDTVIVFNITANLISFAAGYYLAHRGFGGVKRDLQDVVQDVKKLKEKVMPATPQPPVPPNV